MALPEDSISVLGNLGQAEITFATGSDENTASVRIWRDGSALEGAVPVAPTGTFGRIDGDSTRSTLVVNGDMASDAYWTTGEDWDIAAGLATKTAGTASDLDQTIALTMSKAYRGAVTVSGHTAGTVTPRLAGGATVSAPAISANGLHLFRIVAGSGPTTLRFAADASFDGSIAGVVLLEETAACIGQGEHIYELQPLNARDVAGPKSAPRSVTVI